MSFCTPLRHNTHLVAAGFEPPTVWSPTCGLGHWARRAAEIFGFSINKGALTGLRREEFPLSKERPPLGPQTELETG